MAEPASHVQFLNDFLGKFDSAVVTYWQSLVTNVIGAISPVATSLLGIYIVIWGWSMFRGQIQEPVLDGLGRLTRLSMIVSVALSVGSYNAMLAHWISQTPDYLAGLGASGEEGHQVLWFSMPIRLQSNFSMSLMRWEKHLLPQAGLRP